VSEQGAFSDQQSAGSVSGKQGLSAAGLKAQGHPSLQLARKLTL